ncbi:MAG TPA: hypothetical protein VIE66_04595 [Methylocella sp.]|jgi:hypothetical protein
MTYTPGTFFSVPHKIVDSARFRKLSPYAKAAYYAFKRAYNGHNNGNLVMSSRMMAEEINCSLGKASTAIKELVNARFVEITVRAWRGENSKATEYRLLEHKCDVTGMRAGAASNVPTKPKEICE